MEKSQEMRSEKQIQASRANGARSRGPVTAQGKRNSSRNGLRHGFCIPDDSLEQNPPAAFLTLKAEFLANFPPRTPYEVHLVHAIAVARWRTLRVGEAQKAALDQAAGHHATDPIVGPLMAFENSPEFHSLQRYEVAFHFQFLRTLAQLEALHSPKRSP